MSEHNDHPPGEYAIVEFFGHTTMVGRIAEVERFGAKMLALEPIFADTLLPAIFHGGSAIYRMTPCTAAVAFARQPRQEYQLPLTVRAIIPVALLPVPAAAEPADEGADGDQDGQEEFPL